MKKQVNRELWQESSSYRFDMVNYYGEFDFEGLNTEEIIEIFGPPDAMDSLALVYCINYIPQKDTAFDASMCKGPWMTIMRDSSLPGNYRCIIISGD